MQGPTSLSLRACMFPAADCVCGVRHAVGQEYGALHRRYGSVQQLRQALAANSTLAASHSLLASLLRASTAAGAPNASAGSSAWHLASPGADASGGPSDDAAGLLAAGPQPITDDHVQSALRLAMSNLAAQDEEDAEEDRQGADANTDGSKEVQLGGMHYPDAHAQDDVQGHEAAGTLPVPADAAPDDLPVLLDSAALDVTGACLPCPALCSLAAKRRQSTKIFDQIPLLDLHPLNLNLKPSTLSPQPQTLNLTHTTSHWRRRRGR